MSYLWGLFNNRKTVKEMRTYGFERYITDKWDVIRGAVQEEQWSFAKRDHLSLMLCEFIKIGGYAGSLLFSFLLTVHGEVSIGAFGTCILAFASIQDQMKSLFTDIGKLPERMAFAEDYFTFLERPEEKKGGLPYGGLTHKIKLDAVTYHYPNSSHPAVKHVSFTINKGEKIAIVGENGSGKTTLSKLIIGLYPCEQGSITYDGTNLKELDKEALYRSVSAISQQIVPYHFSLRESVALGDLSGRKRDSDIHEVLDRLGLKEAICELGGIDTPLGKEFGGAELSGGQWQKLAIARALLKPSEFVLLDEPTSALDPLIETEILSNFIKIAKDKTAIMISHRVGLCQFVDKIIVMKKGEVAEVGTHEQLMKRGEAYYRLFTAQQQWYA